MARRSIRGSGAATTASATRISPAVQSTRKRAASSANGSATKAAKVQTTTDNNSRCTPTKSKYFEQDGLNDDLQSDESSEIPKGSDESDFEEGAADELQSAASEEDDVDDISSDDAKPARRRKSRTSRKKDSNTNLPSRSKGSELWREGVATGLEPGTQIIIKKPKARPAGKTPYRDETLHPNTLLFLKDLKENNDREWLKSESNIIVAF